MYGGKNYLIKEIKDKDKDRDKDKDGEIQDSNKVGDSPDSLGNKANRD